MTFPDNAVVTTGVQFYTSLTYCDIVQRSKCDCHAHDLVNEGLMKRPSPSELRTAGGNKHSIGMQGDDGPAATIRTNSAFTLGKNDSKPTP